MQDSHAHVQRRLREVSAAMVIATLTALLVAAAPGRADAAATTDIGYAQVVAGASHTLAVTADGRVLAWGWNLVGELGDGTITDRSRPVEVVGLPAGDPVVQVAAGHTFSMALTASGKVFTWGGNSNGQLGIGSFTDRRTPVQVTSWRTGVSATGTIDTLNGGTLETLPPITQISASGNNGFALGVDGYAYAWGSTSMGTIAAGVDAWNSLSQQSRHLPRRMSTALRTPLPGVVEITSGSLGFALLRTGDQKVWFAGDDTTGAAGQGSYNNFQGRKNFLVEVTTLTGKAIVDVEGGDTSAYARTSAGQVYSWGAYSDGELCRAPSGTASISTPTLIASLNGVAALNGGYRAVLFVGGDGTVRACGTTIRGALTLPGDADLSTPTVLPGLQGARSLDLSDRFGVGLAADGSLISWGYNQHGELGDGTGSEISLPHLVEGVSGATQVVAGDDSSYAIVAGGQVRAWGANRYGALGIGTTTATATPTLVPGLSGVAQLSTGMPNLTEPTFNPSPDTENQHHVLALTAGGDVYGWGANHYRQLGDGTTTDRTTPVPIDVPGTVVQVAAGGTHSLALNAVGEVYAWGYSNKGQGGTGAAGDFVTVNTPTKVAGLPPIAEIGAGATSSFARTSAGTIYGWGYNSGGQTGTGESNKGNVTTPTPLVQTYSGSAWTASSMTIGGDFGIARSSTGAIYGWGRTFEGAYYTTTNLRGYYLPRPADVINPIAPFDRLAAGDGHMLGLRADGEVLAWGDNTFNQVGSEGERVYYESAPVVVPLPGPASAVAAGNAHSLVIVGGKVWGWGQVGSGGLGVDWPENRIGVQTIAPEPRLSVTETTNPGAQHFRRSDQTLFVNPALTGALTIRFATSADDPAMTGVDFPALGGGWSGGGAGAPSNNGYERSYTFSARVSGGRHTVTAKNGGTTVRSSELAVVPDATAPVGGRIRYPSTTTNPATTVTVEAAEDAGSGVAGVRLESRTSPLTASGCSASWTSWSLEVAAAALSNTRLVDEATCYQYRAVYTDQVGNSVTRTGGTLVSDGRLDFGLDPVGSPASGVVTVTGYARQKLHTLTSTRLTWSDDDDNEGTICTGPTLAPDTGAFSCTWDTSALPNGSYVVGLSVASDTGSGSTSRPVTVQNGATPTTPPATPPTGPPTSSPVSGPTAQTTPLPSPDIAAPEVTIAKPVCKPTLARTACRGWIASAKAWRTVTGAAADATGVTRVEVLAYAKIGTTYQTVTGGRRKTVKTKSQATASPNAAALTPGNWRISLPKLPPGTWTIQVRAADPAGNLSGWTTLKAKIKSPAR